MASQSNLDISSDASSAAIKISTQVMVAAVILLFVVIVFVFFLYLYARRFFSTTTPRPRSHTRFIFTSDLAVHRGLDTNILNSIPITVYNSSDYKHKDALECAVCLSDVTDGEKVRLLPNCTHGFHLDCIDMWFHSHSTCPLCRTAVAGEVASDEVEMVQVPASLQTNVLFWGNQDSVNSREVEPALNSRELGVSRGSGRLVIEIPSRRGLVDGFVSPVSSLPSSRQLGTEEMKSPVSARFRSFRKLWSRGNKSGGSSCVCSPRDGDVEMGFGGFCGESSSRTPKTPKTPKTPTMNL